MAVRIKPPTKEQIEKSKAIYDRRPKDPAGASPEVERLVEELIGRIADKWTMIILELLSDREVLRFTQLSKAIGTISQKMLTQTLRQMERDGLVKRTVHPVVPPKVEYQITDMGLTLGASFCGVWVWAEDHLKKVTAARARFDKANGKI